jgi:hypothetical protein
VAFLDGGGESGQIVVGLASSSRRKFERLEINVFKTSSFFQEKSNLLLNGAKVETSSVLEKTGFRLVLCC